MSDGYVNRADVIAELYPGAVNDVERLAEAGGGWCCEQHPHLPFPHDDCAGPGMLRSEADRQPDR